MDKNRLRDAARNNIVTIMFIVLCAVCMAFSGYAPNYVLYELFGRLSRNMFIVLSLIIPIVAGMGINFAITIGAMAAQIACLLVLEWGVPGIGGLALAALLTVPLGGIFGFLIGKLLNRMKGQEMIGSMILGYFANGLYQLLFLFIFDNIIPIRNPNLTIKGAQGIANTMDLSPRAVSPIRWRSSGSFPRLRRRWCSPSSRRCCWWPAIWSAIAGTPKAGRSARRDCRGRRRDAAPRDEDAVLHGQRADGDVRRGGAALPVQRRHHAHEARPAAPRGRPERRGRQRGGH